MSDFFNNFSKALEKENLNSSKRQETQPKVLGEDPPAIIPPSTISPQNPSQSLPQNSPYPEIENAVYSPSVIKLLKNLAYARESEFTAVSTYVFQEIETSPFNAVVADALEFIGRQEMEHIELLGSAIRDFGGSPDYANSNGIFWTARNVNTETNIRQFLQNNIRAEQRAIAAYTNAAASVQNPSLSALLLRIAEDEMEHARLQKSLLVNLE